MTMARKLLSKDIELSPQQQALSLLLARTSVTATAEEVREARQTVSGWRHHDPQFRDDFQCWYAFAEGQPAAGPDGRIHARYGASH